MSANPPIHDISDPAHVKSGMYKALKCLQEAAQADSELWTGCYVFACTCIDGLTRPRIGHVGEDIVAYIKLHFSDLEASIGAQKFYENFRCDAVHQFAMKAPYAIGRGAVTGPYVVPNPARKVLNVDRFVHDVLKHLTPPTAPPGPSVSSHTAPVTGIS